MFNKTLLTLYSLFLIAIFNSCGKDNLISESSNLETDMVYAKVKSYKMPEESSLHEGTWLQWPHQYQYGSQYRSRLDPMWIDMTAALVTSEKVHIIAYNTAEQTRINNLLISAGIPLGNIDYTIAKTNDVWVRDNGPVFVRNNAGALKLLDFNFNGWGNKAPSSKDNVIPGTVAGITGFSRVNLNGSITTEGGAFEVDGNGVFMATKSAILNNNRNPGMSQVTAENVFASNLGVSKFIWLTGVKGLEITDMHIDGFARFGDPNTIVTMNNADLLYWEVPAADIATLFAATNIDDVPYNFLILPLTQNNVVTHWGKNLGYKGSYVNFYTGNTVILVPTYNDLNDAVAIAILQSYYPGYNVIGIDVSNLYNYGGMVHCVTQQQPVN